MAGFFGQIASSMGQNMVEGQQFDLNQAKLEEHQQQVAQNKMNLLQQKQTQDAHKAIGSYITSTQQNDKSTIDDPEKSMKMFANAEAMAIAAGDYTGAEKLASLAKGKRIEAAEAKDVVLAKVTQSREDLSKTAADYDANPTAENASVMTKAAIAAGHNVVSMPPPGSPEFKAQVNQWIGASASAKELRATNERAKEVTDDREYKATQHDIKRKEDLSDQQRAAALQIGLVSARRQNELLDRAEDRRNKLEDSETAAKRSGEKLTAREKSGRNAIEFNTSEIARNLSSIGALNPDTKTNMFTNVPNKTVIEALLAPTLKSFSPAQSQIMEAAGTNMGNLIGNLEAALGGRGAGVGQQAHIEKAALPQRGDSPATTAFKLANVKEIAMTAIRHAPGNLDQTPKGKALLDELEKAIPWGSQEVISRSNQQGKETDAQFRKAVTVSQKYAQDIAHNTGQPSASAGTTGPGNATFDAAFSKYGAN